MFDVNAKRVKSPLYKLLVYLNKYDEQSLENEKLHFLLKNIHTHFNKLIYSIGLIQKFQLDEEFMKKNNTTGIIAVQQVEYCFYKISTIWDIAYEIADILIFPRNKKVEGKKVNKYEYLDDKFKNYNENYTSLNTEWYKEITKVRNKIVHGGINITPFYVNSEDVEKRICFQAYNLELDDLIKPCYFYTNIYNNNINYADNFFTYYTHVLYSYLFDFFDFVLLELTKDKNIDIENDLYLDDDFMDMFKKSHESWLLSDIDIFTEITEEMIILKKREGHIVQELKKEQWIEHINNRYEYFPFLMMHYITDGDWEIVKKDDE